MLHSRFELYPHPTLHLPKRSSRCMYINPPDLGWMGPRQSRVAVNVLLGTRGRVMICDSHRLNASSHGPPRNASALTCNPSAPASQPTLRCSRHPRARTQTLKSNVRPLHRAPQLQPDQHASSIPLRSLRPLNDGASLPRPNRHLSPLHNAAQRGTLTARDKAVCFQPRRRSQWRYHRRHWPRRKRQRVISHHWR
jgi:hypothetical protein